MNDLCPPSPGSYILGARGGGRGGGGLAKLGTDPVLRKRDIYLRLQMIFQFSRKGC